MKKLLSIIISITLIVGTLPLSVMNVFAATDGYYTYTVSNGETTITSVDRSISGDVTVPSTLGGYPVTSIGDLAFVYCTSLTSVIIPASIGSIGGWAFEGCTSLINIAVNEDNIYYADVNGVLFDKNMTTLIAYPCGKNDAFYSIPNGVTNISDSAFAYSSNLISVTIPYGVESIGNSAFEECLSLESVVLPESVTNIGGLAFSFCSSLNSITIPDSVTSIGAFAFSLTGYYNDSSNWENGALYIDNHLVETDDTLPSKYTIKDGTKTIAARAFEYCDSLVEVTIPSTVVYIGFYAFSECTSLVSVTIPDGVIRIDIGSFNKCSSLKSVNIGCGVKSIGSYAFNHCYALEKVNITDISSWCNIKFGDSDRYGEYESNPVYFSKNLYFNGELLTNLSIPEDVTSVSEWAFYSCESIKSITIPKRVERIGSGAFGGCSNITTINYYAQNLKFDTSSIFSGYENLTTVNVGNGVETIPAYAFSDCPKLTSIIIPNSVTNIGDFAFSGCSLLNKITIPDSVKSIGVLAFSNTGYCNDTSNWTNDVLYIDNHIIAVKSDINENCIIKDGTICIADYAFRYCDSLKSIKIPNSLMYVGYSSFYGCTSLTDVYYEGSFRHYYENLEIGDSNSDFTSAEWHFAVDDNVYYTYNEDKMTATVTGCNKTAQTVEIPQFVIKDGKRYSVTEIGEKAFFECSELTNVYIPESVTKIDKYAFAWCSSLTKIEFPKKITSISEYSFAWCNSLKTVVIPENVTSICEAAFYKCESLVSVTIPKSITSINTEAFDRCYSLTTVYFRGKEEDNSGISIGDRNLYFVTANWYYDSCIGWKEHNYGDDRICDVCGDEGNVLGDLNGDGEVNTTDLATMKLFLAGVSELDGIDLIAGDLNGDGAVNTSDLASLKLYLAGV